MFHVMVLKKRKVSRMKRVLNLKQCLTIMLSFGQRIKFMKALFVRNMSRMML